MEQGKLIEVYNAKKGDEDLKIIFRYPSETDAEPLMEFVNSLVRTKAMIDLNRLQTLEQEEDHLSSLLVDMINRNSVHVIVECDSKIVGKGNVRKESGNSSHVGALGIAIIRGFRDIGIGKKLMEILEREAKDVLETEIIILTVHEDNERAISLYKKFNYAEAGRIPDAIKRSDKTVDKIIMVKKL